MTPTHPTRLLFVVGANRFAGAEEALRVLISELPDDLNVTIAGPHRPTMELVAGDRRTVTIEMLTEMSSKRHVGRWRTLQRQLARIDATVVHLNKVDVADLRYVEVLLAMRRTPVVSVVHHVERPTTRFARRLAGLLARRARAVVAVSERTAVELEPILELPAGTVRVIPNALPPLPTVDTSRPPAEPFTVGVLARLVAHKAVDRVIEAMVAFPTARLLIGGAGPERPRLEGLAGRLGLADQVEFLGWTEPRRIFDRSHLVVSAAYIEGHPMTLIDAQRRGLPVVAADVGGVADIVEHGRTGLLVAPHDVLALSQAIDRLMRNPEERAAMGRAAVERSGRGQTPETMVEAYLDLYGHTPAVACEVRG